MKILITALPIRCKKNLRCLLAPRAQGGEVFQIWNSGELYKLIGVIAMYKRSAIFFVVLCCLIAYSAGAQEVLRWQDCLKEASQNQPDLIVVTEGITQSKNSKTVAASGFFPQIAADATASTAHSRNSGSTKNFSYGVSGDQFIFDGFKTINQTRAASEDIKASKESFRFVSSQVRWRLRTAFIDLLKAQSLVNLTEDI